jgi:hypothetical protein
MTAKPTDLYLGRAAQPAKPDGKPAGVASDPQASPRMLDIVQRNGDRQALPYPYLVKVKLIGNAKLELTFTEEVVTLTGRNLGPVYQQLLLHAVWRIEESSTGFDDPQQESWIETVTVKARALKG